MLHCVPSASAAAFVGVFGQAAVTMLLSRLGRLTQSVLAAAAAAPDFGAAHAAWLLH